jgi:predicted kinase
VTFLLQMAGRSGVGKSSVAAGIARATGAAVVDLDLLKSTALDVGASWELAGRFGYEGLWAVAESLLAQGFSVICDSPCRFENIVAQTMAIAERQNASYCFVECVLTDQAQLAERVASRPRKRSQVTDVDASSADAPPDSETARRIRAGDESVWATVYPPTPWLQLDTAAPLDVTVAKAVAYLAERNRR